MLIEFCCPMCKAPLAIKKQVVGGQVNCPSCQKLILLPAESPLKRKEKDIPPFQPNQNYKSEEVAEAIMISVGPYRRDLESKANLLNDAVEMVKIRNDRIRAVESLMLNTQKELWELEVDLDEQKSLQNKNGDLSEEVAQKFKEEKRELAEEIELLLEKKSKLKARLTNMVEHSENLEASLKNAQTMLRGDGPTRKLIDSISKSLTERLKKSEPEQKDLDLAGDYLKQAAEALVHLSKQLTAKENERKELEEKIKSSSEGMVQAVQEREQWQKKGKELENLVNSSGEEMELAVQERNQWRKKSAELEKQNLQLAEKITALELQVSEAQKLQEEWNEDRDHSKRLRGELEENLELLRGRIEKERAVYQKTLEEKEAKWKADILKKTSQLEKKLKNANQELDATEEKLATSLQTQRQLAEQNMQSEQERKKLKAHVEELQDQLDAVE